MKSVGGSKSASRQVPQEAALSQLGSPVVTSQSPKVMHMQVGQSGVCASRSAARAQVARPRVAAAAAGGRRRSQAARAGGLVQQARLGVVLSSYNQLYVTACIFTEPCAYLRITAVCFPFQVTSEELEVAISEVRRVRLE